MKKLDRKIEKTWLQKWQKPVVALSILGLFIVLWLMVFDDLGQYRRIKLADITIAQVTHQLYKNTIPIRGQVIPLETFYLTATEGGRVERLHVEDGQILVKGQALMDLSNPGLQLRSIESEAQVGQQMTALQQQELSLL
jgi:HlyD family secretion protein